MSITPFGRPNHIEDALVRLHDNQWFGWTDSKNKIYANLKLSDNNEIYSSIESFFTAAVSSNEILYLCKDNHDKEMGLGLFAETINSSLREGLIDEMQFDRLNNSINLIQKLVEEYYGIKGNASKLNV